MKHHATCRCGHLTVVCEGEPVRRSMCHCLECQKRTGSIFGVQGRWPRSAVIISGRATTYRYVADSGTKLTSYFCPTCGSTVYWDSETMPEFVGVAVGAFADPAFPPPTVSVYDERKHAWVILPNSIEQHE